MNYLVSEVQLNTVNIRAIRITIMSTYIYLLIQEIQKFGAIITHGERSYNDTF